MSLQHSSAKHEILPHNKKRTSQLMKPTKCTYPAWLSHLLDVFNSQEEYNREFFWKSYIKKANAKDVLFYD